MDGELGAAVKPQIGAEPAGQCQHTQVLQDHGVHQGIQVHMECTALELLLEDGKISGVLGYWRDTGRFVLREGNNMAPGTPIENIEAMYYARRKYGEVRTE